jgi:hypothetical protein
MVWRLLTILFLLMTCPLALYAQPRPGSFTTLSSTTLATSSTGAASIDAAGGITAGTGNVGIVDTTGKIPAISSTYFTSLSGTNLTGVARLASADTITGAWVFANDIHVTSNTPNVYIRESDQGADAKVWLARSIGSVFSIVAVNDAESSGTDAITITRAAAVPQVTTINTALVYSGIISATLASGDNNDWNPTGLAAAHTVMVTPNAAGSTITGIAGGVAGRELTICQPSDAANDTILEQNSDSSAANRLTLGVATTIQYYSTLPDVAMGPCVTFLYDGGTSKWLFKSASVLMVP